MVRAGREAEALGAARDGREVDRLNVQPVLGEQDVADSLRFDGASDEQWDDVRDAWHLREAGGGELRLEHRRRLLLRAALLVRLLEVADAGQRACDQDG